MQHNIYRLDDEKNNKLIFNQKIKFIKNGLKHFIIITINNDIFVCGNNSDGQLGTNDNLLRKGFTKIIKPTSKRIKLLECGWHFSIIVNEENNLFGTGQNYFGLKSVFSVNKFTKVLTNINENIKFIRCSFNHVFIITDNSNIYGIGINMEGQLGLIHNNNVTKFTKIENLNLQIKDVQCGRSHSILLDNFGNIYGTGRNYFGQLGLNHCRDVFEFTKINLNFKIKKISCGSLNTIILNEYNELLGTGNNGNGEIGLGDCRDRYIFTKIVIDSDNYKIDKIYNSIEEYRYINMNDNTIYVTGKNKDNKIGITKQYCKMRKVSFNQSLYYLDKFTKLNNLKVTMKYLNIISFDKCTLILESDYLINEDFIEDISLGIKCLATLKNNQITDVTIIITSK